MVVVLGVFCVFVIENNGYGEFIGFFYVVGVLLIVE